MHASMQWVGRASEMVPSTAPQTLCVAAVWHLCDGCDVSSWPLMICGPTECMVCVVTYCVQQCAAHCCSQHGILGSPSHWIAGLFWGSMWVPQLLFPSIHAPA